jgi:hypothetical protein
MSTPTNPYYTRAFNALAGALARARAMVNEFELIQRGFDLIGLQNSVIKYQLSCSDLDSELLSGPAKGYFRTTDAFRLLEVRASLLEPSIDGAVRVSLIINNFNALFTPLQIDEGQKTSVTSSRPATIAYQNVPDDSEVVIDLVTSGAQAKGLIVTLIGLRTGALPEDVV